MRIALLIIALAAASTAWADSTRFGIDVDLLRDDNVTRGIGPDRIADTILSAEGFVTRSILLGEKSGMVLRGGLRYAAYSDFADLGLWALSGRAAYRVQPWAGFSAPWFELAADVQWLKHYESTLRDGTIGSLSASVGTLVTDRVRLTAGLGTDKRSSKDTSGIYDLSTNRIWATFDWKLGLKGTFYSRATIVDGDHVFNAADPANQALLIPLAKTAYFADPALQQGFSGGLVPVAYQVDARTESLEIGFNYALRGNHVLDFSVSRADSETDIGGVKYSVTQFRAAYFYRFQ